MLLAPFFPGTRSLNPVQPRLQQLLGSTVKKVDDCIGSAVESALKAAKKGEVRGRQCLLSRPTTTCPSPFCSPPLVPLPISYPQVLLLENVRFYKEEEKNDPEFAKKLAAPGAQCHARSRCRQPARRRRRCYPCALRSRTPCPYLTALWHPSFQLAPRVHS